MRSSQDGVASRLATSATRRPPGSTAASAKSKAAAKTAARALSPGAVNRATCPEREVRRLATIAPPAWG